MPALLWLLGYRGLEIVDCSQVARLATKIPEVPTFQVVFSSLGVDSSRGRQSLRCWQCDLFLYLSRDTSRDFVLQGDQVAQVTFVRLSPDMLIGCGAHQLG